MTDENLDINSPNPVTNNPPDKSQLIQPSIYNHEQKKSFPPVILKIISYMLSFFLIIFGVIKLLDILLKSHDILFISNDFFINELIHHTSWSDLEGNINVIQYLSSSYLTLVYSILFIYTGYLIILNRQIKRKIFFLAIFIVIIQIVSSYILGTISHGMYKKRDEETQKWFKDIQNIDRTTITDLATIWALKEPQLCKNIKVYATRRNCITEFEDKSLFTIDYCSDLSDDYDKDYCLEDVAGIQKNKEICDTFSDDSKKNKCFIHVAEALKDINICSLINDDNELANTCTMEVGIALRDSSYCDKSINQIGRDHCYREIATVTRNRSLCDRIINQSYKENCFNSFK